MAHKQVMQQALEAWDNPMGMAALCVAMDALRKALEQPEQEPSQWRDMVVVNLVREGINKHKARDLADHFATTPLAAQRPWVGLTDEELDEIYEMGLGVRASIETALDKLEERNNA